MVNIQSPTAEIMRGKKRRRRKRRKKERRNRMKLEMWVNAQRDGRPAEHRWRPLFNAAKFG